MSDGLGNEAAMTSRLDLGWQWNSWKGILTPCEGERQASSDDDPGTPHAQLAQDASPALLAHYTGKSTGTTAPMERRTHRRIPSLDALLYGIIAAHARRLGIIAAHNTATPGAAPAHWHCTHSRQELQENAHYPHTVTQRCLTNLKQ
uniref:Uncharacterized protein n=1 Tax=Rhipicephalus zambeziensis TaxID=60191 RepID=A0A224YKM8_9ACAR